MIVKKTSILKKFLFFNFVTFSVLGLFTIIYLNAIQPNLVKQNSTNHDIVINNTADHLNRLNIGLNKDEINTFLLSARFLFQGIDRVQFFNSSGNLIGDTDILDLDQSVFSRTEQIFFDNIDNNQNNSPQQNIEVEENVIPEILELIKSDTTTNESVIIQEKIKNNFFVRTLRKIETENNEIGFIMVSEQADEIITAVKERKDFIIRTVLGIAIVVLIFSIFLNKYILGPIGSLVKYTEHIKTKSNTFTHIEKNLMRSDEVGVLAQSIDEMTNELQRRAFRAETFSTDLAHEIRNPLASLKGASELLEKTDEIKLREKLMKIIIFDIERIDRLITDYTQMLKDEASLSKEKMSKVNLVKIINNVVEDFQFNPEIQKKHVAIKYLKALNGKNEFNILGIENRLEQVIANLLDNSVSLAPSNSTIEIEIINNSNSYLMVVRDEGPGFKEKQTDVIFKRFYSNRPKTFGQHSGLGLNIVKNIVELHKGSIKALNRSNHKGAQIEISLPKIS